MEEFNMKYSLLIFVCFLSVSLFAEKGVSTKVIESENCTVKVIKGCTAGPLIIFNCKNEEGFKCVDRDRAFYENFNNNKTIFKTVKMSINLFSGVMGDGPNTPAECQSKAQDCVDIKITK